MVGPDPTKRFVQKHSGLIPEGETVLGAVIAESKGGAWRRGIKAGMEAAGPLVGAFASRAANEQAHEDAGGDAGSWPQGPAFWLVITDRQLLVWQGAVGSNKVGPGAARYPIDRVARITVDRKLLISKLSVAFKIRRRAGSRQAEGQAVHRGCRSSTSNVAVRSKRADVLPQGGLSGRPV